jgi:hypothetical protein
MHLQPDETTDRLSSQCLSIAEKIVCPSVTLTAEQPAEQIELLFKHAEIFYKYSVMEMVSLSNLGIDPNLIFPTLSYIEKHFAIPPLLNDFNWFGDTLFALLSFFRDKDNVIDNNSSSEFIRLLSLHLKNRSSDG